MHTLCMADIAAARHANFLAWMAANRLNASKVATAAEIPYNTVNSYQIGKAASMRGDNEAKIAAAYGVSVEEIFGAAPTPEDRREENHIAAWRAEAGLSVEEVAAALGVAVGVVVQLEAGEIPLSAKWMLRLAPVFKTQAGMLFLDPADAKTDLQAIASTIPRSNQPQASRVLRTFTGTGTDG